MEISLAKGNKTGANAVQKWKFLPFQFFLKNSKKVLTSKKNFAIITFVAPQGSDEAANAAGL